MTRSLPPLLAAAIVGLLFACSSKPRTVFSEGFSTFSPSRWTADDPSPMTGTASLDTTAGEPAPALELGGAPDAPNGVAVRPSVTLSGGTASSVAFDVALDGDAVAPNDLVELSVSVLNGLGTAGAMLGLKYQNNTGPNGPYPGDAGIHGALVASAGTVPLPEVPVPVDTHFHHLRLSLDGDGGVAFQVDQLPEVRGFSGFPSTSQLSLRFTGLHQEDGVPQPAAHILLDNVEVTEP